MRGCRRSGGSRIEPGRHVTPFAAILALLVALCADRWLGEPRARWHPVVWIGNGLAWAGRRIAPEQPRDGRDFKAFGLGTLAWWAGAAIVFVVAWVFQSLLSWLPEAAFALLAGLALKPLLAWAMLRDEVRKVEEALGRSLGEGRAQLARIVSRDVSALDAAAVRESAIESLAENFNDSVVAPVFWFVLAGLPGAALYRYANTADAMWGYRGMRGGRHWEWAGKWAARADDVLSWLPARLTAVLLALAALGRLPWRALPAEAARTPSPNSGWPMAAMALLLGVRLGKPGVYTLNAQGRAPQPRDTHRAIAVGERCVLLLAGAAALALGIAGPQWMAEWARWIS